MLPQMNGYVKYFNENKCMNLLVHHKEKSASTVHVLCLINDL